MPLYCDVPQMQLLLLYHRDATLFFMERQCYSYCYITGMPLLLLTVGEKNFVFFPLGFSLHPFIFINQKNTNSVAEWNYLQSEWLMASVALFNCEFSQFKNSWLKLGNWKKGKLNFWSCCRPQIKFHNISTNWAIKLRDLLKWSSFQVLFRTAQSKQVPAKRRI